MSALVELRIVHVSKGSAYLQYRGLTPSVDASGAFCPPGVWSEWQTVPTVDSNDVALEDVRAAGGIVEAP